MLPPFAPTNVASLPDEGRTVLGARFTFDRPGRRIHRRVEVDPFDRHLHALDSAGSRGKAGDGLCRLGGLVGICGIGKMFASAECLRTDSDIIGRIGQEP